MSSDLPSLRKRLRRRVGPTGVRYLTFSTYRRTPLFANRIVRDQVAAAILAGRGRCGFALLGWVVMLEHEQSLPRCRLTENRASSWIERRVGRVLQVTTLESKLDRSGHSS